MATHVFYSPHSDDEAIGMAGSIARAKAEGHRVVVVLVTDNRASARGTTCFPSYSGDLTAARLIEWRESLRALEVDEVRYLGIAEQAMAEDRSYAVAVFLGAVSAIDHELENVIHHTVRGASDIHQELGRGTMAHAICEEVAQLFVRRYPGSAFFLHAVYVYSFPLEERSAPLVLELTPAELAAKRRSLEAYKAGADRIGYGYASVPELIDAALDDPHEYLVKL